MEGGREERREMGEDFISSVTPQGKEGGKDTLIIKGKDEITREGSSRNNRWR